MDDENAQTARYVLLKVQQERQVREEQAAKDAGN
jgi:hypothetical protein